MSSRSALVTFVFAVATLVACSKKETKTEAPPAGSATTGSGSAIAGSGSAMAGSGSADTGSGSAMAGSGSADTGSGSAAAGSGSAAAGSGSAAAGSGAGSGSAAEASGSGAVHFDKLSHDDKVKFMKTKVMPAMKAAFQKFDPKEFANFTCKTCHGKDPQKNKYEMPTKDLPALDFDALKKGDDAKIAKFMGDVVKPEMAKILGEPEYSDTNPQGFGCLNCHTAKK